MNPWLDIHNVDATDSPERGRDVQYAEQRAQDIIQLLEQGVVEFEFFRVTYGSQRKARGTLNTALFSYTFKGTDRMRPPGLVAYWDFERRDWRSFYVWNVRKILATGAGRSGLPSGIITPQDVDEDGDVRGPGVGIGNGKRPRSKSGEPLTPGEVKDGIYSGLTMRVVQGNMLAYTSGRFVTKGLVFDVVRGGTADIPENFMQETRYDLVTVDTSGVVRVDVGVPGAPQRFIPAFPSTVIAELTTPPMTDGVRKLSRLTKRNVSRVPY